MPFKHLLHTAWQSLLYRRGSVILTVAAISVSVFTLLGTEHIRQAAKHSFNSTVSGVDLIVGPRTSDLHLLLTTVFRIGQPSQNMSWRSYQNLTQHPNVAWAIPISLGDSHQGFRVVGTQAAFFERFKYGQGHELAFKKGAAFTALYDVVIGAQVAKKLGYTLGDSLVLAHGFGATSFVQHKAHPFRVVGQLKPTGTPVDNALYVSLASLEAIHQPTPTRSAKGTNAHPHNHTQTVQHVEPSSISAAMLGLNAKLATFKVQRAINTSTQEPLSAILPGVALTQLWQMSRGLENTLLLMARLMLLAALLGLAALMLASLRERRYELTVMRTLGASTTTVFVLIQLESFVVASLSIVLGGVLLALAITLASPWVITHYGIDISQVTFGTAQLNTLLWILLAALAVGTVPAGMGLIAARKL